MGLPSGPSRLGTFTERLPTVAQGNYAVFADIVRESGFRRHDDREKHSTGRARQLLPSGMTRQRRRRTRQMGKHSDGF